MFLIEFSHCWGLRYLIHLINPNYKSTEVQTMDIDFNLWLQFSRIEDYYFGFIHNNNILSLRSPEIWL